MKSGQESELLVLRLGKFEFGFHKDLLLGILPGLGSVCESEIGEKLAQADSVLKAMIEDRLLLCLGHVNREGVLARRLASRPQSAAEVRTDNALAGYVHAGFVN